jgi:hypothetical protein
VVGTRGQQVRRADGAWRSSRHEIALGRGGFRGTVPVP